MNLGSAPFQFRYFLATPFAVLADVFGYLAGFIMGEDNARWQMLKDMQSMGMVEVLSPEEYEAKYGKLPKNVFPPENDNEQEDNSN